MREAQLRFARSATAVVEVYANKSSDEEALTTETTDDLNLEHILTEEITDSENENVTFEAKHFSEYIQVAREAKKTKSLNVIYHSNNKDLWPWDSDVISKDPQKAGNVITFPEYTGDKGIFGDDWHFVGWSTDSQANEAGDGHYTQTVYRPGDTYRIPDDRQSDIDFYAIWAQENVKANFYIRLDGTIPTEPQSHAHSSYTTGITIQGALKSATFYTNSTEGVSSQLAKKPAESQIREQLRAKGINYNSETQYILWYVIKYENDGGDNHNWHVDGVLLDKEKVNLAYNPNCNTGEWIGGTMPDGSQYIKGAEATVSDKTPERRGYTFVGWNTAADGSGTSYAPNAQFTINVDTTLYAQWSEKGSVLLTYIANEGGSVSKGFEHVAPATGNPQGSEATPASGYRFVNWTLGDTDAEVSTNTILTKDVIDQYAKSVEGLYVAQTFKANFERDPEQKKNLSYTVKHKVDGTVKNTFTEETTVQVLQPNTLTRNLEKEADQKYSGYVKDTVTYEDGTAVTGTSIPNGAVIVVTYKVDDSQKKTLSYTVKHEVNGTVRNTFTEETKVQVLQPDTLTRNLEKEADQKYSGYVKDTVTYEDGTTVTGTSIPNGAVIVVTYKVDDNQKKTLSYTVKHKVNGTVRDTFKEETKVQVLQPDTLTRNLEKEADQNYKGYVKSTVTYENGAAVEGNEIQNGAVIVVDYTVDENQKKDLSYTVQHKVNGEVKDTFTESTTVQVLSPDKLSRNIKLEEDQKYEGYAKDTVTYEDGSPVEGNEIPDGAVIVVEYKEDKNGDQIPDIYQIIFTYESNGNGTVEYVPENSVAAYAGGSKTVLSVTEADGKVYEAHTFTDENGNYVIPNGSINPEAEIKVVPADKYAFDFWGIDGDTTNRDYHEDMSVFRADGYVKNTVFTVYFGKDEIGTNTEKPKTPDGIPDMYQVVFRYISENPSYGTVDGAAVVDGYVMEVVTRPQKADGSYDMDAEVYPLGKVTVTGIGNYTFNHWSDSDTNYANANEIAGHGFKSDMTFVAHFSYDGGNNNNNNGGGNGGNGGGNGGSGSTSGGGSSSSGSRGAITVTSGGPGDQTVTIDAGDVPLAELPDAPVSPVEIDDGEVPLAALPKTGQTTMKLTITLMFSGIFLALTAMSKKHKEEES